MTTASVTIARQRLQQALAEEEKQRCADANHKIEELSHEGAEIEKQLLPLEKEVEEAQRQRLTLHGLLVQARDMIAAYSMPLDPLTFPSDAQIAAHAEQLRWWKAEQKRLLAQADAARVKEAQRPQAIALRNKLNYLEQAIINLQAVAEGRKPGEIEGGVFVGVEDFLGHTDRRFS